MAGQGSVHLQVEKLAYICHSFKENTGLITSALFVI